MHRAAGSGLIRGMATDAHQNARSDWLRIAVATLVGQAQGQRRSDLAERATWRGLLVGEGWMLTMALLFVAIPGVLVHPFRDRSASPQDTADLLAQYLGLTTADIERLTTAKTIAC